MYLRKAVTQCYQASLAVRGADDLQFENTELLLNTGTAQSQAERVNTAKSKFFGLARPEQRVRIELPQSLRPVGAAPAAVPPKVAADISLSGVRILVIDDDEAVMMAMAHLLRSWGYNVNKAETI